MFVVACGHQYRCTCTHNQMRAAFCTCVAMATASSADCSSFVQVMKHQLDDMSFQLIQPDFENATETIDIGDGVEAPYRNQITAQELIRMAHDVKKGRALVMTNYANRGFMQEMMFGTLALLVSRRAPMPLLLIPPQYSFE